MLQSGLQRPNEHPESPAHGLSGSSDASLRPRQTVYAGLRADIDVKGVPILIAEHRTRGSIDLAALSDGTVDPHFLAPPASILP